MSERDWLHLGQLIWILTAIVVIPRLVRSLAWVTVIALAGSLAYVWLAGIYGGKYGLDLDERMAWGLVVVLMSMAISEVQFRVNHGWWRWLDGELGRHRPVDDESGRPEAR